MYANYTADIHSYGSTLLSANYAAIQTTKLKAIWTAFKNPHWSTFTPTIAPTDWSAK